MKIVLMRHAHTAVEPEKYNPLWKLSEKGIEQANALAQHSLVQNIEVIYTSDQLKAIHTGIIVASSLGVPLKQCADLTELTSLTNDWKEDYGGFIHDMYTGRIERHNDGESLAEAMRRFTQAITEIAIQEQNKEVIGIVAHGNVLALFSSQYEARDALAIHNDITMPDIAVLDWATKEFTTPFGVYESVN
jgi:broad specificity phosphatase PhoE